MIYRINKQVLLEEALVIANKRPIAGLAGSVILGAGAAGASSGLIYQDFRNDLHDAYEHSPDMPHFPVMNVNDFTNPSVNDFTIPSINSNYQTLKNNYDEEMKKYDDYKDNVITPLVDKSSNVSDNIRNVGIGAGLIGAGLGYKIGTKIHDAPTRR